MNVDLSGPNITLQGRREEVLSPLAVAQFGHTLPSSAHLWNYCNKLKILFDPYLSTQVTQDHLVQFLALKLISGPYAFSMEATCPQGERLTCIHEWRERQTPAQGDVFYGLQKNLVQHPDTFLMKRHDAKSPNLILFLRRILPSR